jgi:hypothetical protein
MQKCISDRLIKPECKLGECRLIFLPHEMGALIEEGEDRGEQCSKSESRASREGDFTLNIAGDGNNISRQFGVRPTPQVRARRAY